MTTSPSPRPARALRGLPAALRVLAVLALALLSPACGEGAGGPPVTPTVDNGPRGRRPPPPSAAGATPERPHIIVISVDTLRRDHVGFHGYERRTTPALDELAKYSIVFERAYTAFSWTLVAHMTLLTGLHPSQHGVYHAESTLPDGVPTLASRLRQAGYHTMGFHDSKWLEPRYGYDRGFTVYARHHGARQAGEHMARALAERPKDRPFFLFMHLMDAHNAPLGEGSTMYAPPEPFDSIFVPDAVEKVAGLDMAELWKRGADQLTPEQREALVALYDGGIRYVDTKLGEWIKTWWGVGLMDNAVLVITSDHGEGLAQRQPGYGGHGYVYEEGLRVPMIMHLPKHLRAGERVDDPVTHVDLVPTLLQLAGLEDDGRLPGRPLLRPREDAVVYSEQPDRIESFLRWPWKLVRKVDGGGQRLYNLEQDPHEAMPVESGTPAWDERRDITDAFTRRVEAERAGWYRPSSPAQAAPLTEEEQAELRSLGYLGEDP